MKNEKKETKGLKLVGKKAVSYALVATLIASAVAPATSFAEEAEKKDEVKTELTVTDEKDKTEVQEENKEEVKAEDTAKEDDKKEDDKDVVDKDKDEKKDQEDKKAVEAIKVVRIAGKNRYETAKEIHDFGFKNNEKVFVATGEKFPDALVGAVLAGETNVGVMLSEYENVNEHFAKVVKDKNLVVVGGTASVADSVLKGEKVLARLYGKDRYQTAVEVAKKIENSGKIYIASGEEYADALAINPKAIKEKSAILLTRKDEVPKELEEYLKTVEKDVEINFVGGENTISEKTKKEILKIVGKETENIKDLTIAGKDRYETSRLIAKEMGDFDTVVLASGKDYPDALSVSPLANKIGAPILLVNDDNTALMELLKEKGVEKIVVAGGDAAIKLDSVLDMIVDITGQKKEDIEVLDKSTSEKEETDHIALAKKAMKEIDEDAIKDENIKKEYLVHKDAFEKSLKDKEAKKEDQEKLAKKLLDFVKENKLVSGELLDKVNNKDEKPNADKPAEDTTKPDTNKPDVNKPADDTTKPDADKPTEDTTKPDANKPDADKPAEDTTKPDADKPAEDTTKPDADKPAEDTTKPDADKPTEDTEKPNEQEEAAVAHPVKSDILKTVSYKITFKDIKAEDVLEVHGDGVKLDTKIKAENGELFFVNGTELGKIQLKVKGMDKLVDVKIEPISNK